MASEVGAAFVSIIPSMRKFSQMVKAQLREQLGRAGGADIPVNPKIDTVSSSLRSELERQIKTLSRRLALEIPLEGDSDTRRLRAQLEAQLAAMQRALELEVPTVPGDRAAYQARLRAMLETVRARQTVEVHIDTDRALAAAQSRGAAVQRAGSMFGGLFSRGFRSALFNPVIGVPVLIAAAFGVQVLGPAIAAATLAGGGLGAIFAAAFLLRADPEIRKAFDGLTGSISAGMKEAVQPFKGPLLESLAIIRGGLKDIAPDVRTFFSTIAKSGGVQEVARGIAGIFRSLRDTGALKKFGEAIGPALTQLGMALPDIGNAFSQLLISISKPETAAFLGDFLRAIADGIRTFGDWLSGLVNMWEGTKSFIKGVGEFFSNVGEGLKLFWGLVTADIDTYKRATEIIKLVWRELWGKLTAILSEKASEIGTTVKELPGKIVGWLGDLGSLLVKSGEKLIDGLISGIKSKLGALGNVADSIAGTIRDRLPFSPAKTGPLSGTGNPYHSGQVIASDLASGVQSKMPGVVTAADQLAGTFAFGGRSTASAGASVAGLHIDTAGSRMDLLLVQMMREAIAEWFGGDPDRALASRTGR